jgi:hypothetical protein
VYFANAQDFKLDNVAYQTIDWNGFLRNSIKIQSWFSLISERPEKEMTIQSIFRTIREKSKER